MTTDDLPPLPAAPVPGGRWRHRTGGVYEVVCVGYLESDLSGVVVYRADSGGVAWVRPVAEFMDGRFTRVGFWSGVGS